MKKLVLGLAVLFGFNIMAFSLEEASLSMGGNVGNFNYNVTDMGKFQVSSLGVNLGGYLFPVEHFGVFFNYGLLFPVYNTMENNYKPMIQNDFLLGPGFKLNIIEKLDIVLGFGFHMNLLSFDGEDNRISFGIGGDVGIRYQFTDVIYIIGGSTVTWDPTFIRMDNSVPAKNWENTSITNDGIAPYSPIGFRQHIAIGFKIGKGNNK